jgi:hypothetical protein
MHRGARRLCVTIMGRDGLRILSMVTVDRCANPNEHAVYLDSNSDLELGSDCYKSARGSNIGRTTRSCIG